jgi:hypothetical protein
MLQQGFEPSGADWRRNCLQWMIETHQPFSTVDDPGFRRMIEGITPKMKKYLFGRNAARDAAESEFEAAKDKIRDLIKESVTRIHISMDVWTAKFSKFGILGVVAHFATRHVYEVEIAGKTEEKVEFKRRSVLLALRRLKEAHAGEYEAKILADVIKEYEFADNLGVCVADNAGENNTSVRALFRTLHPELKDPAGRRVRCLAHIINLAAKAYLYGGKTGNKETAAEFVEAVRSLEVDDFDWESARALWRQQGPLGKLHNLVKFIRSSSQRKEEFRGVRTGDLSTDGKWCIYVSSWWCDPPFNKIIKFQECRRCGSPPPPNTRDANQHSLKYGQSGWSVWGSMIPWLSAQFRIDKIVTVRIARVRFSP